MENAKGSLHELATMRFSEQVLRASHDVEVIEIAGTDQVLQQAGERVFGPAAAKAVGASHDVPVVFAGHMKVSNVKPSGGLSGFGIPHMEATVSVELSVGAVLHEDGRNVVAIGCDCQREGRATRDRSR